MGIGSKIKEARLSLGMTQEQLANKLGITKSAIANYENGVSHPKEDILYKLFSALNVDANYLFEGNYSSKNITIAAHRIDGYDNDLPEEAQQELENFIGYLKTKYKKK
ncbi:MAG TPA: XRE family transcriptional regulator [Ruminiclostridium sp.]